MAKHINKAGGETLSSEYLRPRDFEYAQPLYDLAYLLQIDALAKRIDVPEYRTFSLWKAALGIDSYTAKIDTWLADPKNGTGLLDFEPSPRIHDYLRTIRSAGTIPELDALASPAHRACLRFRAVRGLGLKQIAEALAEGGPSTQWLQNAAATTGHPMAALTAVWNDEAVACWEPAHVVPPLLRLLNGMEQQVGRGLRWTITQVDGPLHPIKGAVLVRVALPRAAALKEAITSQIRKEPFFRLKHATDQQVTIHHQMGWKAMIVAEDKATKTSRSLFDYSLQSDALGEAQVPLRGDLHAHTNWSDGAASLQAMSRAAKEAGLEYMAVTDHSRSSKLQGGLAPVAWVRQAVSLSLMKPEVEILHGIEVDILADGSLDLPANLLAGMDIVVGSVHTNWSEDRDTNTDRILKAIYSGSIDILGHPTSTILGKPGVPSYHRPPVEADWDKVFRACKAANVALEFNCFPSRFDLLLPLLVRASESGCWISFGSDAHARAHLVHLRAAGKVLPLIDAKRVLNLLPLKELRKWLKEARQSRVGLIPEVAAPAQQELFFEQPQVAALERISVRIARPEKVPAGSRVVGLDLTASKAKPTGVALLDGLKTQTTSLESDDEILDYIRKAKPRIVSIDSPLGLPGGGDQVQPFAGIVRVAENDLSSVGIPAYPALIDSMKPLTLRGIRLRRQIEALPDKPVVIESYPGAAQDILCIPRKQKGLELLRAGLRELGLRGPGLETESHDEMDAITSAIVGRYYEIGRYEPMGVPAEAQLIVPKLQPLEFDPLPVICLTGRTGAGKSVVARYLALFYGFRWLRTRDVMRELLRDDLAQPPGKRLYDRPVDTGNITDRDLTDFGIVILERYQQSPLLRKLRETVAASRQPIVIDAARDLADFRTLDGLNRAPLLWFVDAPDTLIQNRLAQRNRPAKPSPRATDRIDQNMKTLRALAHHRLSNDGSLEELRWRVDDAMFSLLKFDRKWR